jgi:peptide/nickel transport system permease protein
MKPQKTKDTYTYWGVVWNQYQKNKTGMLALIVLVLFIILGLYAPFFASSKPIVVVYDHKVYFPLFRYLFYPGFYTKKIDVFYNVLMFTLPITILGLFLLPRKKIFLVTMAIVQVVVYGLCVWGGIVTNPAENPELSKERRKTLERENAERQNALIAPIKTPPSWDFELRYLSDYEKLNLLLRYRQREKQNQTLAPYARAYKEETGKQMPTLFYIDQKNLNDEQERLNLQIERDKPMAKAKLEELPTLISNYLPFTLAPTASVEGKAARSQLVAAKQTIQNWENAVARKNFLLDKQHWLESEQKNFQFVLPAFITSFHWEDDAGGGQTMNKFVPWWAVTRVNRKDLMAALIFGVRISLVVGITAVAFSLAIGIPIGMTSGFFAGTVDIIIFRFIEIWEAMPTFFMLLLIVAITQSKSIFLVVAVLGIFGWTGFGRFIRGEVLKQRNLPYVLACKNLGFSSNHTMFSHILPNAIPPILTLLPFSMMAAITSEAGLSFLGLGEANTPSWGVLMDEGRSVFPGESYLLWPPAILLTILLTCIALVGDAFRDAIDPKLRR